MEADNIRHKPSMDETGRKSVDQEGTGQEEVKSLINAIQVQPNVVNAMSESTACLSSRNHFRFLHLPAEVRNMVYRNDDTYGVSYDPTSGPEPVDSVGKSLPELWQPPITRVNRQIRQECLDIFYDMFYFLFNLNVRSEEVAGEERVILHPASEGQASLQSFHEMIQAFAPSPTNMLRTSNLRFLSNLIINITLKGPDEDLGSIGFHMTSADKTDFNSLAVRGLDWNCRNAVLSAWVEAAKGSAFEWDFEFGMEPNKFGYLAHRALVEKMVGLLCLIAEHCPQLTRSVSLIYKGHGLYGEELEDLASDATCLEYMSEFFSSSDTVV
ncbi:hypothetical protein INS49_003025 [Diaporthe citri]|uniref:uncharacterized protein n=1 Tax=Diaporthe citri TaxID=83186 RepID=UPI001C7E68CD|nr:uncharacterized protein INS49_003025 [Diaporthe citri]KAG6368809.1 hypothetical protein INS49_003025 [Diaporthe citri]